MQPFVSKKVIVDLFFTKNRTIIFFWCKRRTLPHPYTKNQLSIYFDCLNWCVSPQLKIKKFNLSRFDVINSTYDIDFAFAVCFT